MPRKLLVPLLVLLSSLTLLGGESARPNVLFIMADDHTTQAFGVYGSRLAKLNPTPNIDRLAKEGMRFNRVFCNNSICVPRRTGQHSSDAITDLSLEWIKTGRDKGKPFFLMHHFKAPHDMTNQYRNPEYAGTIAGMKAQLKTTRAELVETDRDYPEIQKIIDAHWGECGGRTLKGWQHRFDRGRSAPLGPLALSQSGVAGRKLPQQSRDHL
jgi:hypothetical protein